MAKKKSNFITYELKNLEKYLAQLQAYLDDHPADQIKDRLEHITTPRGGTMIKVIASEEDQLKAFTSILEKLPNILADLNRLRKEVDDDKKEVEVRGGQDMPGFMDDEDEESEDREARQWEESKKKNKGKQKEEDFDDDSYYDSDAPKQLPAPEELEDDEEYDDD